MEQKPRPIKHDIMRRVVRLYIAAIIIGIVIAARLVYVQFLDGEVRGYADQYDSVKIFRPVKLDARRGTICARTGEPLATSIVKTTVYFDFAAQYFDLPKDPKPRHKKDSTIRANIDALALALSDYFGDRPASAYRAEMLEHLRNRKRRVRLFRDITFSEWVKIRRFPIISNGYTTEQEDKVRRIYTLGTAARSIIGNVNAHTRSTGLENVFDDVLRGEDGMVWTQHIAPNFRARTEKPHFAKKKSKYDDVNNRPAVDGADVITTIDPDIQAYADKVLRERMESQRAICGSVLVMEVETGDLLAVSNYTRVNEQGSNRSGPKRQRVESGRLSERENIAFTWPTEPGSTFKLATMLALLEEAKLPVETEFDTGKGAYTFREGRGTYTVHDSDGHALGVIDMHKALVESSNVYFARAAYETYQKEPDRYTDFLRHLHLDRKVCVGLPEIGEAAPHFRYKGGPGWEWLTLLNMAYGQGGLEITPLQTITLYNAVANGGRMVAPRIVTEVRRDGKTIKKYPVEVLENRICSKQTIETVKAALVEAATEGTGKIIFGENQRLSYVPAMKTGTAQFAQDGHLYRDGYYVGSMAMFFPADNPRYTIVTNIHTRRGNGYFFGASLAGPVNRDIATYIFNRDRESSPELGSDGVTYRPERIKGGNVAQVREVAEGLDVGTAGDRRAAWGRVKSDSLRQAVITATDDEETTMPDVTGMGLKDALFLLEQRGLKVSVTGKGAVTSQSIRAGQRITRGMNVSIVLK